VILACRRRAPAPTFEVVPKVDVVVVAYNSRPHLRSCVEALAAHPDLHVIVVDNASVDDGLATVDDLPVTILALDDNRGFAAGCNAGMRAGSSPFVLLLNPDARIEPTAVLELAETLVNDPVAGAAAPRVVDEQGRLDFSQRRFPRLRSTYAQALFLHRLFPDAAWSDETVRQREAYAADASPEWVSGACLLVRRSLLDELGGLDEGFFMYCEDKDLCRRIRDVGSDIRFVSRLECLHVGGASGPSAAVPPRLARSRVRYALLHRSRAAAAAERAGIVLGSLTHALAGRGGRAVRAAHVRAAGAALAAGRAAATAPGHRAR
jgi:GT2 family glycosyltransferase